MITPAIIAAECLAMNANNIVGFTVAIAASLIANGGFTERGLVMPMRVPLSLMQPELAKRDIHIMTNID